MIIGLSGENCSGKGTVAEYLSKKGFHYLSLSDVIREELATERKEITRESLIEKGNELRKEFGPGILAKKVLLKVEGDRDYVIDSVRNPGEVKELRKIRGFFLVYITAPPEKRFERMKERGREGDPKTFDAFMRIEKVEEKNADVTKQQLLKTFKMSDKRMINDSNLPGLYGKIDVLLGELSKKFKPPRPGWDEYFLEIARVVGTRGTCDRGRNGAVLVRNRRILTTGYVGAPMGLPHCDEVGHLMSDVVNPDGTVTKHCIRTIHAEQNAIVQAALHGVSTDGGTLYVKFEPCFTCAKMIINAGIKRVVCLKKYHAGDLTREFFKEAGVEIIYVEDKVEEYPNQ